MSILVASNGLRVAVRVAVTGLTLALLSGCSSDVTRFSNPFGSPAYAADPTPTSDILPRKIRRPVVPSVISSKPLAAPATQVSRFSVPATPAPKLAHAKPVLEPMTTASVKKRPVSGLGGWSAAGGTPIVVATGESASMLSKRYGVPEAALLSVNGFSSASQVQPGARMIVPVYNANGAASAEPQALPARVKPVAQIKPVAPVRQAAIAPVHAREKLKFVRGPQPANLPLTKQAKAPAKVHVIEAVNAKPLARPGVQIAKHTVKPVQVAAVAPIKAKRPELNNVDPTPTASLPPANAARPMQEAAAPVTAEANPEFRWPARGRIIQGFKSGGNDGINIAVPEGTSVKAAEGGVVAYAGSELKGYGNLVLIRHPNGYVSAYANNGELNVKRGEQVKRGQIIAKSGQTGNVSSPQLHFELRKGSTPVDPTNYLAGL